MSQSLLTGSWPTIVTGGSMSKDNVIVSGIYQSYVSSTSNVMSAQSRSPMSVFGITTDTLYQRTATLAGCTQNQIMSQKFNPSVISTARPLSTRPQQSYSTVIPSTKVVEKTKKKSKSRIKSKYLIKVINIQENINPGETMLTFEMMLPMHQMRFTCSLNNEINTLDVSNSVEEDGQIPGELGKKDILESLVNTVKKICYCLTDNINSISLNEEYVFHPCLQNSGLVKLSDCNFSIQGSLDSDNNPISIPINSSLTLHPIINYNNSCASSANLSRQTSTEDVSWPIGNLPVAISDQHYYNLIENDLIMFGENDVLTPTQSNLENQKTQLNSVCQNEHNSHSIVSSKCSCPTNDSVLKIPDYIFTTVKQIIDKLLNLQCKGIIILPQSNDILTRNYRVLEIPADHMFVGLPCSDSSYNVIKGQKDKDFIIAKDTRDPENATEKCVYQKPSDGAVLLDSSGEIQYIQRPSLIIPSKPGNGNEKTEIKALPVELTHHGDQSLDCDQMLSVLQSLIQIQHTSEVHKDELFDSPVLLESKPQIGLTESQRDCYPRRGSDSSISSQMQPQSHIQVEPIFCQYVALAKAIDHKQEEVLSSLENYERDLPKQQIRNRKISNESLESISINRTRATSTSIYGNESDNIQSQTNIQRLITNNQADYQNSQKTVPLGTLVNQMNIQRMPNVPASIAGQFILTNQNTNNPLSASNIYIQGVPNNALYSSNTQTPVAKVIMSQSNSNIPVVIPIQNSMGYNFLNLVQNQMVLQPGVMSQSQISQLHQIQQNSGQRITVPSSISSASITSSQILTNMSFLQHNVHPVSQQVISTPIHPSQITQFKDQHPLIQASHVGDMAESSITNHSRPFQLGNIRQLQQGSSHYIDQNVINSIITDNLRIQLKNQPQNAQPQTTPLLYIPHQTMLYSNCNTNNNNLTSVTETSSKMYPLSPEMTSVDNQQANVVKTEIIDNKQKTDQQTIGRFVIRSVVTDGVETS